MPREDFILKRKETPSISHERLDGEELRQRQSKFPAEVKLSANDRLQLIKNELILEHHALPAPSQQKRPAQGCFPPAGRIATAGPGSFCPRSPMHD